MVIESVGNLGDQVWAVNKRNFSDLLDFVDCEGESSFLNCEVVTNYAISQCSLLLLTRKYHVETISVDIPCLYYMFNIIHAQHIFLLKAYQAVVSVPNPFKYHY